MKNNDEPRLWQPKTRNAVLGSFPVSGKECGALPRRRYVLAKRMSDGRETGRGDEEEDVRGSWNSPLRLAPPIGPEEICLIQARIESSWLYGRPLLA